MMKLFLDDSRVPEDCASYMHTRIGKLNPIYLRDDWTIVRTYDEFIEIVSFACDDITHVSFDHDLGDIYLEPEELEERALNIEDAPREYTGYDCAVYLKDFCKYTDTKLPHVFVHSMNPVGRINIESLFRRNR